MTGQEGGRCMGIIIETENRSRCLKAAPVFDVFLQHKPCSYFLTSITGDSALTM